MCESLLFYSSVWLVFDKLPTWHEANDTGYTSFYVKVSFNRVKTAKQKD